VLPSALFASFRANSDIVAEKIMGAINKCISAMGIYIIYNERNIHKLFVQTRYM
jgi:hypothetical protein